MDYYDHFSFKYLTDHIRRIGKPSRNGFVYELWYEREGIRAASILKTSAIKNSHPLLYEGYIGLYYMNQLALHFPCFLQTYETYKHQDRAIYNSMKSGTNVTKDELQSAIIPFGNEWSTSDIHHYSCTQSDKIAVHIEYVPGAIDFDSFIQNNRSRAPKIGEDVWATLLYQVYKPLAVLMGQFTHNDLHAQNIMIYKIPEDKWVRLIYKENGREKMAFNTQYVVKLIDYGMCHTPITADFSNKLTSKCKNPMWFDATLSRFNNYISSSVLNPNRDLQAAAYLQQENCIPKASVLGQILSRIHFVNNSPPPPFQPMVDPMTGRICNAVDMIQALEAVMGSSIPFSNSSRTAPVMCTITCTADERMTTPLQIQFNADPKPTAKMEPAINKKSKLITVLTVEPDQMFVTSTNLKAAMIPMLFDWMYDVSAILHASIDQFALASYIVRHWVQYNRVLRAQLQLIGCVALMIAGIYTDGDEEKMYYEYRRLCADAYPILAFEHKYEQMIPLYKSARFQMSREQVHAIQTRVDITNANKNAVLELFKI